MRSNNNNVCYLFRKEMKNELLEGRTVRSCANDLGISESYLHYILQDKRHCNEYLAKFIVHVLKHIREQDHPNEFLKYFREEL